MSFGLIRLCGSIETKFEGIGEVHVLALANSAFKAGGAGVRSTGRILAAISPDSFSRPAMLASLSEITTSILLLENRILLTVFWMIRHWYKRADYFIEKIKDPKA